MPEELRSVPAPSDHATGQLRSPDALSRSSRTALTPRVAILGLILIPINALWITWTEFVSYSDNVTTQALFFNAVALLLILQLVNGILNRWAPQCALSRAERLGLYLLVAAASGIAGHDTLQILFTTITYPVRHALSDTCLLYTSPSPRD